MTLLRWIEAKDSFKGQQGFPFDIPVIQTLKRLEFTRAVTILVGENGTGKSTVMESIAALANLPTVGRDDASHDDSLEHAHRLAKHLKLVWNKRTHRGFFLRAEDFFNFCHRIRSIKTEAQASLEHIDDTYGNRSNLASILARAPHLRSIGELEAAYGPDLDARSHGESFMKLFETRLVPDGLYLLDEPEAPLSPTRQLALLSLIKSMTNEGCQFIIATHSPIIMAIPDAQLLSLDSCPPSEVEFNDLEHVKLLRNFLNGPERFLRHL